METDIEPASSGLSPPAIAYYGARGHARTIAEHELRDAIEALPGFKPPPKPRRPVQIHDWLELVRAERARRSSGEAAVGVVGEPPEHKPHD